MYMWIIVGKNEMYSCLCRTAQVHHLVVITRLHHKEWYCLTFVLSCCRFFCGCCFVHSTLTRCSQTFVILWVIQDNNVHLTQFSLYIIPSLISLNFLWCVWRKAHHIKLWGHSPLTLQILPASIFCYIISTLKSNRY